MPTNWHMDNGHYDFIIIGSGAGGGTLAYHLAPSGKKILLIERGPFVPRVTPVRHLGSLSRAKTDPGS